MTIEVRRARPEEYAEAGRITALAYREFVPPEGDPDWDEYLVEIADIAGRAARTEILIAVEDGRILGSVTLELHGRVDEGKESEEAKPLDPSQAHVRMLGIDAAARGRGIGRMLMDACIAESVRAGKTLLTLNTTARMKAAQAMYASLGFERGEDVVFPDGFRLWSYSLRLDRKNG